MEDKVYPIYSEAHALPYPHGFFGAIVSMDAYHYFGTDDLYLRYLVQFLKPKGQIDIACPGFKREVAGDVPEHLKKDYADGWFSFHGPA